MLMSVISCFAQPSTEQEMMAALNAQQKHFENTAFASYPVRNIGPTVRGGRIVDIEVNLRNTKEFYVGFASGGIFKTVNNGITFDPIFDNNGSLGIGDFALSQSDPKIIYVGTGEKNSSRSSYAGTGVYKTTDGGSHWQHLGLAGTQHIGRVVLHPNDNNTLWVAAIGPLYSTGESRGVYKSTDGGATWRKTLYVNDSTGIIDLAVNPANPQQLWASSWERSRTAGHFKGNGPGSSIYQSDDGGETWLKSVAGFPQGKQVGRIGLEVSPSNPEVIYAILDNQGEVPDKKESKKELTLEEIAKMNKATFLKLDDKELDEFLKENGFPKKYSAVSLKKEVESDKITTQAIANYFGGDANKNLFKTKIIGAEIYRSDDAGATWKKMNSYDLDGVFFTYGYYFAEMRVAPDNEDLVYIYGVPMLKSRDGGVTWHRLDTLAGMQRLHVDHHALWINPADSHHMLLGNDGGLYQSYDEGANWLHINNMPVGQFYTVNVDMQEPYSVYGGLQDNGVLRGSSHSVPNVTKHWVELFGGDGMYVAPDPRNPRMVFTGFQFGNYFRLDMNRRKTTKITPQHDIGKEPLRWNWCAPLILSKHNPDIVYMAAQKVFRSLDQGDSWEIISDDLTTNQPQGNVPFSTISYLTESPVKFGLLYAGTDDGNVWVSRDGGVKWEDIRKGLPEHRWVSWIAPSPHEEGTVFLAMNGYRNDDFKTYLYASTDYGNTWRSVKGNLPESVANAIVQDPVNPSLLYCGLDNGTYVSLDNGNHWDVINGLLNVASYAMIVHPRDNELVVATHGRSIFVADVKPLQALGVSGLATPVKAFETSPVNFSEDWGETTYPWSKQNTPAQTILYYVGSPAASLKVEVYDAQKNLRRTLSAPASRGFHTIQWDLKLDEIAAGGRKKKTVENPKLVYASKEKYTLRFINGTAESEIIVEVK
jgi:photosystem II stability/assembly factor-like uncharacterized protein